MPSNSGDYQLKVDSYTYRLIYMNLMVTENLQQVHTQKKENNPNITQKESIKPQGKPREEGRNKEREKQPEDNFF